MTPVCKMDFLDLLYFLNPWLLQFCLLEWRMLWHEFFPVTVRLTRTDNLVSCLLKVRGWECLLQTNIQLALTNLHLHVSPLPVPSWWPSQPAWNHGLENMCRTSLACRRSSKGWCVTLGGTSSYPSEWGPQTICCAQHHHPFHSNQPPPGRKPVAQ